jgi:hypothetical protein
VAKLDGLSLRYQPRHDFVSRYARRKIAAEMAGDVLALAVKNP